MSCTSVKEVYLRVIDATIARTKSELEEEGEPNERLIATLDHLRTGWQTRLLRSQVFDERTEAQAAVREGRIVKNEIPTEKAEQGSTQKTLPPVRYDKMYSASASGAGRPAGPVGRPQPHIPAAAKKEHAPAVVEKVPQGDGPGEEPPAKRARVDSAELKEDGSRPGRDVAAGEADVANGNPGDEESESSVDSELEGDSDQEDPDHFILAQHDKVRKGQKWKVMLRDGVVHINGRDYLFGRATCDLEW